jgi:hypothetical protein
VEEQVLMLVILQEMMVPVVQVVLMTMNKAAT